MVRLLLVIVRSKYEIMRGPTCLFRGEGVLLRFLFLLWWGFLYIVDAVGAIVTATLLLVNPGDLGLRRALLHSFLSCFPRCMLLVRPILMLSGHSILGPCPATTLHTLRLIRWHHKNDCSGEVRGQGERGSGPREGGGRGCRRTCATGAEY